MAMPGLFVYGTLCWNDLLEVVGGQTCPAPVAASLPNYATHWVDGQNFPMIAQTKDAHARGFLLRDPHPDLIDRLTYYEAPFGYVLADATVDGPDGPEAAYVFRPPKDLTPGAAWDLQDWVAAHGPLAREAAVEVMARMGHDTPKQIVTKYPMMQVRASARLMAQDAPSPASSSGLTAKDVRLHDYRVPYAHFFALAEIDVDVPRFDGSADDTVTRAGFLGTEAAIVLPYDPVRDRVLLVEQFRVGPYLRSDANPWMMEPIAGRVDAGEDPATTAHREGAEEAGLTFKSLHLVHSGYSSPGCSTEFFHVYIGIADLPDDAARVGGLETESEDIQGHVVAWDAFLANLNAGQYPVTPLALAGYWLAHNRVSLRSKA